jgi:hypothetical protein
MSLGIFLLLFLALKIRVHPSHPFYPRSISPPRDPRPYPAPANLDCGVAQPVPAVEIIPFAVIPNE